jgi:hypothetical protein
LLALAWKLTHGASEVSDNTWKAGASELNNTEDSFIKDGGVSVDQRKLNAVRAYFEWSAYNYHQREGWQEV